MWLEHFSISQPGTLPLEASLSQILDLWLKLGFLTIPTRISKCSSIQAWSAKFTHFINVPRIHQKHDICQSVIFVTLTSGSKHFHICNRPSQQTPSLINWLEAAPFFPPFSGQLRGLQCSFWFSPNFGAKKGSEVEILFSSYCPWGPL